MSRKNLGKSSKQSFMIFIKFKDESSKVSNDWLGKESLGISKNLGWLSRIPKKNLIKISTIKALQESWRIAIHCRSWKQDEIINLEIVGDVIGQENWSIILKNLEESWRILKNLEESWGILRNLEESWRILRNLEKSEEYFRKGIVWIAVIKVLGCY